MAAKPFASEETWRRETATKEWRFEEETPNRLVHASSSQQQSCPLKKRRAESIISRTDDLANKRRRGATRTEAEDRVHKLYGGTVQTANNGTVGECWLNPGGRYQPAVQKVTASSQSQTAQWRSYFVWTDVNDQTDADHATDQSDQWQRRAVDFPCHLAQTSEGAQYRALVKPESRHSGNNVTAEPSPNISKVGKDRKGVPSWLHANNMVTKPISNIPKVEQNGKGLPSWVHPKWTNVFLPTLTHALFISKQPFRDFRPSSPIFVATIRQIFGLVYPSITYHIDKDNVLVGEAASRLANKKSKIAAAVMREVEDFFEQETYLHRPEKVKDYVRWALQPDGPAYYEAPTPITCTVERSHPDYIHPKGTFQSPFIAGVAKHFFLQAKGSVLDPPISASNPPKGLYGLLLISVERAFFAFSSGNYKKPRAWLSHENYQGHVETYMDYLDTVQPQVWKEIMYRATSDVNEA